MRHVASFLFIIIISLLGCKDKKITTRNDVGERKTDLVVQDPSMDSAEIRRVVSKFYHWYNKNYTGLQEYKLYSSINKKDSPPYKINWDEVEKYQNYIRKSIPELGEEFLKHQSIYLKQSDSAFKVNVEDEIPYGFDYDWYTNSQEDPQYLLDEMNKEMNKWDIKVNGNDALVRISAINDYNRKQELINFISLAMKKENNVWKIAKIGID